MLQDDMRPTIKRLKLNWKWTLQLDNDPKHFSKSTEKWLREKKEIHWDPAGWFEMGCTCKKPLKHCAAGKICLEEWEHIPQNDYQGLVDNWDSFCQREQYQVLQPRAYLHFPEKEMAFLHNSHFHCIHKCNFWETTVTFLNCPSHPHIRIPQ